MRDYTRRLMREPHEKGTPVMRTLFLEFPENKSCWDVEEQYMYGDTYLCTPVANPGNRNAAYTCRLDRSGRHLRETQFSTVER